MNSSNSSSNIMVNDPDKSFYVDFRPKADSSWKQRLPIADTILGFTESMMNLSVSEPCKVVEEKKVSWIESESDGVITVLDSDSDEEIEVSDSNIMDSLNASTERIVGPALTLQNEEEPSNSKQDESLDRFNIGGSTSKDNFKASDIEMPETDESDTQQSTSWKCRKTSDESPNITLERYETAKQEAGESKSAYFERLRQLARKHFDEEVKKQIMEEEKAEAMKALNEFGYGAKDDLSISLPASNKQRGRNFYKPCWDRKRFGIQKRNRGQAKNMPGFRYHRNFQRPCTNCAKIHLPVPHACPAWNKICRKCGRFNHFSSVCSKIF